MKKNILVAVVALFATTLLFAQVSTTPEVPRNYKPKPKELLPMPDSLTTADIFPVLGHYSVAGANGDSSDVYITLDEGSKGVVWISGLPQGKIKAELKASPAVYKIPVQKTFLNDARPEETVSDYAAAEAPEKKQAKVLSGKSVQEGTLIYDKESNALYINLGTKFKAEDPASVFPELITTPTDPTEVTTTTKSRSKVVKGVNYTGAKVVEVEAPVVQ